VEEVRQECRRCIREAGKNGGYILAACDMLPTETEPEKVRAMIEIACREGKYGSALPGTA
jgi:uroporphyrinogen-III decarboxylase